MRRIINSTYITLDGVVERPHLWPSTGTRDDEWEPLQTELLLSCDAMIMGRRTYEGFAAVWPTRPSDPYVDKINAMTKYVVSSSLTDPTWQNTSVIPGDEALASIAELKASGGGDIIQYGVGQLTHALLEHGLLDELRLWIHPLFVGDATAADLLFRPGSPHLFELSDLKRLGSGVVIATYTVQHEAP